MMVTTLFTAPWIVAYQNDGHRVLRDGCVVVEDDRVTYVGTRYLGDYDRQIDCKSRVITPGLISTHAHVHESPIDKSIQEDIGFRQFWLTGLVEILPAEAAGLDEEGMRACVDFSMLELVRSGTTTVLQMGPMSDYVAEEAERFGLRAYIAESYRSGHWYTQDGNSLKYEWDEAKGRRDFERALEFVERVNGRAAGRIRGFLAPAQVDTCTEELLRLSREAADTLQVPISLHAAQGVFEFYEMTRRHGLTPIEWLDRIGFLSDRSILGHGVFVAGNSWVNYAGDDLKLLSQSHASVSYNSWCFVRRGILMESFPAYLDAGINVCLGTDTASQSMIESMKWAAIGGKIVSRRADTSTAARAFDSATLGAARALQREDLGRIAPGAKADLLFWRTDTLSMAPLRDPIRNIVYYAQSEDLVDVMVDGRWVMRDREVPESSVGDVVNRVSAAGSRVWTRWPEGDWAGRALEDMCPQTYPLFEC